MSEGVNMGSGYRKKCPKCGFEFFSSSGVGFLFPMVYEKTVQKAKEGELGEELREFFAEYKDGAINAERVTLCCEKCGNLSCDMDLTMYVPNDKKAKENTHGRWSVAFDFERVDYVTTTDLERFYDEYTKYPHKCDKCGGTMRILKGNEELSCPKCKVPLETADIILWD